MRGIPPRRFETNRIVEPVECDGRIAVGRIVALKDADVNKVELEFLSSTRDR
jgi:hypothetical protein